MRFLIKLLIKRRAAHQAEEDLLFFVSNSNEASDEKESCPSDWGGSPFLLDF